MKGGVTRQNWAEFFNSSFDFSPAWGRYCKNAPQHIKCQAQNFKGDVCLGSTRRLPGNDPLIDPNPPCMVYRRGNPCSDTCNTNVMQTRAACQPK